MMNVFQDMIAKSELDLFENDNRVNDRGSWKNYELMLWLLNAFENRKKKNDVGELTKCAIEIMIDVIRFDL